MDSPIFTPQISFLIGKYHNGQSEIVIEENPILKKQIFQITLFGKTTYYKSAEKIVKEIYELWMSHKNINQQQALDLWLDQNTNFDYNEIRSK